MPSDGDTNNLGHQLANTARGALKTMITDYDRQHQFELDRSYDAVKTILLTAAQQGAHRVVFEFDMRPRAPHEACKPRRHGCPRYSLDENQPDYESSNTHQDCVSRPAAQYSLFSSMTGSAQDPVPRVVKAGDYGFEESVTRTTVTLSPHETDALFFTGRCGTAGHGVTVPEFYMDLTLLMRLIARLRSRLALSSIYYIT